MDKRTLEAVRYLGYGKHAVDDQTLALIRDSFEDLERVAKRRIVYRIFELKVSDEEHLNIEGLEITSKSGKEYERLYPGRDAWCNAWSRS